MSTIDERIVAMKFNNADFQKRISDTLDSLRKLKDNMNFGGAKNALVDLDRAGKNFNLDTMAQSLDGISSKFSAMSIIGITALATIAAKGVEVGLSLAKNMFVDPAKSGLAEYETNLNSIQTILANTSAKGTTLDQVNAALEELNEYSDKTIYNFSEMARNIGTFTAAGVDLDTSTSAIKGIANLAAVSGSSSEKASTAMYQLSQALASGRVSLMDWNSVVNAGMGGEVFQNALKETARVQGVAVDDIIAKNGSFRDSLQEGWLTTEILTDTLSKFTGELTDDQLKSMGYTQEQIVEIQKMASGAVDAATKVKTFTQLMSTLGEQSGSGWAKTWQLILGDFDEAKEMFTSLANTFGGFIQASADARNKVLGDWNKLGGRTVLIEGIVNVFNALMKIVRPIGEAFREIFPPMTGQRLYELTVMFRDFTELLIISDGQANVIKNTFKFFFGLIKMGVTIIGGLLGTLGKLFGVIFSGGDDVAILTDNVAQFFQWLADGVQDTAWITSFFEGLGNVLANVVGFLRDLAVAGALAVASFAGFAQEGAEVALTRVRERLEQLGAVGQWFVDMWNRITDGFARFMQVIKPVTDVLGEMFRDIGSNIAEAFSDVDFNTALDVINVGLLGGLVFMFKKFLDGGIWSLFGKGAKEGLVDSLKGLTGDFKKILGELTSTLEVMQTNIKADTLLKIAGALALLTASVVVLSLIDSGALTKALIAMATMFYMLNTALVAFSKTAATVNIPAIAAVGFALILFASAIVILTGAVAVLAALSWEGLIKGLVGVLALMWGMSKLLPILSKAAGPHMFATAAGLVAMALAIRILADAVSILGGMDLGEMAKGLVGVGALIGGLLLFTKYAEADKGAIVNGVGLILLATALKILASAVGDFAAMNVGALIQGVGALGVVLAMLSSFMKSTAKIGELMSFAAGLVIMSVALKIMASAVSELGSMPLEDVAKGVLALGAVFLMLGIFLKATSEVGQLIAFGAGLVLVAIALKVLASALADMGGMSWEEIGKSLVVLAGSLLILAGAMYLMTGALPGAAALLIVAVALSMIAPVLVTLGKMSWEEIGRGLVALGAALLVIGAAALVLAPVLPLMLLLGLAVTLLGGGLALVGAGILMFALGLTLLAAAGLAALPVIVALVTGILALIPFAMEQLGLGIVAFATVIGENAPVFIEAFTALIMSLLEAIQVLAPEIIDTLVLLIEELLNGLVEAVPKFVDAGMKLIIGILDGIGDNIGDLIDAGTDVVVNFLQGIQDNVQDIIDEGAETIVAILNGIAVGIEENKQGFIDAGSRIFRAVVDGVASAIEQGGEDLAWAGQRIGQGIINGAMNALSINSPSKVFRDYIMGAVFEGVEDGGDRGANRARHVGEDIGNTMVNGVKNTLANLAAAVDTDMSMEPVIRPVLDMSQASKDAMALGTLLNAPVLRAEASLARAAAVQAEYDERTSSDVEALEPRTKVTNINMNQTNNSPKALTTAEIYRQTKNQVSQVKVILEEDT